MNTLDAKYWDKRYQAQDTGWDTQQISPPLKCYFDQLANKNLSILIPGAGNSYEAEYLYQNGFKNTYVLDFAQTPLNNFQQRCPDFPKENLIQEDFFSFTGRHFDLIVEQTFFCAINPELRSTYAHKVAELLKPQGKLVGLLFNDPLFVEGPPFGGKREEYLEHFKKQYEIVYFDLCFNSLPPRAGRELFILLKKRPVWNFLKSI
ncbi:methyltransferase domain-containing protein [Rapidithrix thailandica]|uniref:Methyltransferase domain-containing protein n=1 Tax=Rapidithrix thailandica TaxID=413964 RepID=A0AAW9SG16_9BACT